MLVLLVVIWEPRMLCSYKPSDDISRISFVHDEKKEWLPVRVTKATSYQCVTCKKIEYFESEDGQMFSIHRGRFLFQRLLLNRLVHAWLTINFSISQ